MIEATLHGLRVGIPLGFLKHPEGRHDVRIYCAKSHFTIEVDGYFDDDMFRTPTIGVDLFGPKTLSSRVKAAKVSVYDGEPGGVNFSRKVDKPIQYWTPPDHNAWVGDVAPGVYNGRLHLFYLFDRRHHRSKGRAGGHYFAHLSSEDLVNWTEHPTPVPINEWWETHGTGTPFVKDGKLCLSYGLHTSRITRDPIYPIGGTFAESEDGIHFVKSGKLIHAAQNPSVYNRPDGGFELVSSYGAGKGIFRSDDFVNWKLYDDKLPFQGDCPSLFDWHGHRYLIQGIHIAERNYLCDTHTAVAVNVYEQYLKETGDDTPCVIASTASPYKFAKAVLEAVNNGAELPQDEFAMVEELSRITGTAIPAPLAGLKSRTVLHRSSVEKEDMSGFIREFLSR